MRGDKMIGNLCTLQGKHNISINIKTNKSYANQQEQSLHDGTISV